VPHRFSGATWLNFRGVTEMVRSVLSGVKDRNIERVGQLPQHRSDLNQHKDVNHRLAIAETNSDSVESILPIQ
jgi:hypothetical protein